MVAPATIDVVTTHEATLTKDSTSPGSLLLSHGAGFYDTMWLDDYGRKGLIRMTAVKEQFRQMIPDIEQNLPLMQDSDVQQFVNLWIRVRPEKSRDEKMAEFEADMDRC